MSASTACPCSEVAAAASVLCERCPAEVVPLKQPCLETSHFPPCLVSFFHRPRFGYSPLIAMTECGDTERPRSPITDARGRGRASGGLGAEAAPRAVRGTAFHPHPLPQSPASQGAPEPHRAGVCEALEQSFRSQCLPESGVRPARSAHPSPAPSARPASLPLPTLLCFASGALRKSGSGKRDVESVLPALKNRMKPP